MDETIAQELTGPVAVVLQLVRSISKGLVDQFQSVELLHRLSRVPSELVYENFQNLLWEIRDSWAGG